MRYPLILKSLFLFFTGFSFFCAPVSAHNLRNPDLNLILAQVKKDYGINVHYAEGPKTKPINLDYSLASPDDKESLKNVILLFVQEIQLYPKNFFRSANCQDIYFVQKLFYKQKPVDGVFSEKERTIYYDYARENNNPQKIRHNIHHELYHMIGSKRLFWKTQTPSWESLNRPDFVYDIKYSPHGTNPINFFAPAEPGFITHYAMASAEEDRAEVFACLMLPEERRLMEQWAKNDQILFNKLKMMQKFIKEAF